MANIVAIVGRPNVGKSTLFNRLVEKRQAIMDNEPGVTRDRHYGYAEWTGKFFTVIDTGGFVTGSEDKFESAIRAQVKLAIEEATAIIFVVDVRDGLTGFDKDFANILRASKKPVFVAANKTDTPDKTSYRRSSMNWVLAKFTPFPLKTVGVQAICSMNWSRHSRHLVRKILMGILPASLSWGVPTSASLLS